MNAVLVLKKARLNGEPDPIFSEHIAEFAHAYGNTFGMNKFHPITKENSEEACLTGGHDNITNNFIGHHVGNFDGIHAIIRPIKNATHNDRPLIHWCLVQREPGLKTSLTSATKDIAHAAHAAGYSLSFQPNDFAHYYPSSEGGLQTQIARTRLFDKWMERLQSFSPVEKRLVLRKEESLQKSAAWTRKEGQNPKGGLNAKGRASAKREGHNLKPPVKSGDNPRRASFLARMGGSPGPEHDEHGEPTRLLLALEAWGASSKIDAKRKAKAMSERLQHKQVKKTLVFRTSGYDDLLKGRGAAARLDPSSLGHERGHSIHDPMMLKFKATHDSLEKFSSLLEDRPAKPFFGRLIPAGEFVHMGYFGPKGMTKLTVSPTDHDTNPELPTKMAINSLLTPGAPVAHPKILNLGLAHDAPEPVTRKHEQEIFQGLWDAGYRGRNMTYMTAPDVQSTAAKYAHLRAARGQPPRKITAQRDHLFAPVRQRWAEFVDGKNGEQHSPEPESHLQRSMNKGIDNFFHMAIDPVTIGTVATAYAGYKAYRKLKPTLAEAIKRFKEMQGERKAPPEEKVAKKSISSKPSRPLIFRSSL